MTEGTKKLIDLHLEQLLADNTGVIHNEAEFRWGYNRGVRAFENIVWHEKKDKPNRPYEIIVIADGNSLKCDNNMRHMQEHERWAYLRDLLPNIESPIKPRDGSCNDDSTKMRNEW